MIRLAPCRLALLLALWLATYALADEMKVELVVDQKLLHSHFGVSPYPNPGVTLHPQGIQYHLTKDSKRHDFNAVYSFFKITGDFEISAHFDWTPVPVPKDGYGVSCGMVIETNDKLRGVQFARGNFPDLGSGFRVTTNKRKPDNSIEYNNGESVKSEAKKGRLILAREKKEIICSVATRNEPEEICRIPFTDATVQRVIFFADPGGVSSDLNAWLHTITIRAGEMSHHKTKQEYYENWWGFILGAALLVIGPIVYFIRRRNKARK